MERTAQMLLRAARPTATAPIASTSTAAFSTTASVSGASPAELRLRAHRKRLRDRKAVTDAELARTKPDPILGYPTNMKTGHHTWENCELAKLILSRDDVWSGKAAEIVSGQLGKQGQESLTEGDADRPTLFNFGLTAEDASVLLDRLPAVSAQRSLFSSTGRDRSLAFQGGLEARMEQSEATERTKAEAVARVVDLRNADSKGIEKFNIARIVDAFSRSHRPGPDDPPRVSATPVKRDVGCPEVQAAILTYRIHYLVAQLRSNVTDIHNRRVLKRYVMQRKHVLAYLKRESEDRYDVLLPRLGLSPRAVEGEIIIRKGLPPAPDEAKF